jgi:hypothetical protein
MRDGVSAPVYFAGVAVVSALMLVGAMALRPSFAYTVRDAFGLAKSVQATPASAYTARVAPLFEKHCIGCHGEKRQKAELRLDSFASAMRGGRHGAVIRAGDADASEIIARITLPRADEKAMPPEGKEPLSADDVSVVRLWVAAGASPIQGASEIAGLPPPIRQIDIPELDVAAVNRAREPLAALLQKLQARYPAAIAYASRGTADIEINASLIGPAFGDEDLTALAPLLDQIVRLDLSGTAVTDASASALAGMSRLRVLRLLNTQVTEKALSPLREKGVRIHDGHF